MTRRPLTALVHELLEGILRPGDTAVDATAGNGHDTLFLARSVGAAGSVYAVDLQRAALARTRRLLESAGVMRQTRLIAADHATLLEAVGHELQGRARAVTFNLGYLPGSDLAVVTTAASTIPALAQGTTLLAPGGRMTILAYTGHAGGRRETLAVAQWLETLATPFRVREVRPPGTPDAAPRLFVVDRPEPAAAG